MLIPHAMVNTQSAIACFGYSSYKFMTMYTYHAHVHGMAMGKGKATPRPRALHLRMLACIQLGQVWSKYYLTVDMHIITAVYRI